MQVYADQFALDTETGLATHAAGPNLMAATVDLFQNDINPGRNNVSADFTAATFTGYAQSTPTPEGPYPDPVHGPLIGMGQQNFVVGATPTVTNQIYGYYVRDAAGKLVCAERFSNAPIPMVTAGSRIAFGLDVRVAPR